MNQNNQVNRSITYHLTHRAGYMCYSSFTKTNNTKNGHGFAVKFRNFVLPKIKSVDALTQILKKEVTFVFKR